MHASCPSSMSSRVTAPSVWRQSAGVRTCHDLQAISLQLRAPARAPTKPANHRTPPSSGTLTLSTTLPYKAYPAAATFVTLTGHTRVLHTHAVREDGHAGNGGGEEGPAGAAGLLGFAVRAALPHRAGGERDPLRVLRAGTPRRQERAPPALQPGPQEDPRAAPRRPPRLRVPRHPPLPRGGVPGGVPAAAPRWRVGDAGDHARAQARFWAAYSDKVYEVGTRLWKLRGDARAQARAEMVQVLKNLEGELGDKAFFGGEAFGFVDVAVVPFVAWLPSYERYGEFSVEEVAPRLAAWGRRCGERESVAKSLHPPEKVDEFITLLKQIYGIE